MKKVLILYAVVIIIAMAGCPGTNPDPDEQNPTVTIESPFDVMVAKDPYSNALILSWKCNTVGLEFEVERVLENDESTLLTIPPIQVKNYRDITYPPDTALLYRVRAVSGSNVSEFIPISRSIQVNTVDIAVQHTYATRLELKSQIAVRWDPLENQGVDIRYLLRRYDSRENGEETPDVFSKEFVIDNTSVTINGQYEYIDTEVTDHTPYYYSVQWENETTLTGGKPGAVVLGMSSEYDHHDCEPNNDITDLDITQSCLPLETQKMVIFDYVHPGDMDIDWYNYYGKPCDLKVAVSLESGFNLAGNLDFTFVHNDKTYEPQKITAGYPFSNVFVFPREYFTSPVVPDPTPGPTDPPPPTPTTVFAVNCGGGAYTASDGTVYDADKNYSGGTAYDQGVTVSGTSDPFLYRTERYGTSYYSVTVPNGNYRVTLHFAENYHTSSGSRIFNVRHEGIVVISNLDIYAQAGVHAAYSTETLVTVTDGQLNIGFVSVTGDALINAIKVDAIPDTGEPVFGPGEMGLYRTYDTITIDGNDNDWEGYTFTPVNHVIVGSSPSAANISASISFLWDTEALYYYVKVTDSQLSGNAADRCKKDGVKLFLDVAHDTNFWGADDFVFLYCWNESILTEDSGKNTGVVFSQVTTATGYNMEVKLPWSLLTAGTSLTPAEDMVIGLEVWINDNDGVYDTVANRLYWNGTSDCFACANTFGDGILTILPTPTPTPEPTPVPTAVEEEEGAVQFRIRPSGNNTTIYGMYTITVSEE
ncbi:MAG: hypothetical protein JXJ04_04780 [Spirochaetales bacterium]|nr:hypothetical protein [Spirochaetales bacterium]